MKFKQLAFILLCCVFTKKITCQSTKAVAPDQVSEVGMFATQTFTLAWNDEGNSTNFMFMALLPSAGASLDNYYIAFAFSIDNKMVSFNFKSSKLNE
jgi:hypothetical protein